MRAARCIARLCFLALLPGLLACSTIIEPFIATTGTPPSTPSGSPPSTPPSGSPPSTPPISTPPSTPAAVSLTGDWNLTGNRAAKDLPVITATLLVDGNQVTAVGDMQYSCGNGPSGGGGSFALSGQIDASGSFHLAPPSNLPGAGVQLSIDGTVPSGGQPDWSGTYSLSDAPGYTSCLVNETGSFTATAFAPLNNTVYAGSVSSQFGTLDLSVVLTEGAAVTQPNDAHLPVSGTITVSGSSCFSHGTTNAIAPGEMEGDISFLRFEMDDGSHINFSGIFGSPDESTLQPVLVGVFGGQCSGQAYLGAMVRQ